MVRAFFGNMWHVINRCCCCMQSTTQGKNTSNNNINLYATLQRNSWHVSLHVLQSATLMPVPNMPGKLVLHAQLHTSRHAQVHHHCHDMLISTAAGTQLLHNGCGGPYIGSSSSTHSATSNSAGSMPAFKVTGSTTCLYASMSHGRE